jgi:GNAT superfamily N-acetyltransferase
MTQTTAANIWFAHHTVEAEGGLDTALAAYADDRQPDEARVEHRGSRQELLDDATAHGFAFCLTTAGRTEVTRVHIRPDALWGLVAGAPDLWFVLVMEPDADPAAANLVGFASADFPDGTFVDDVAATSAGITAADQVAALRWFPGSGQVHQIFVSPQWRRRRVAVKMHMAAELVRAARGWPAIRGGEIRTELGEAYISSLGVSPRITPQVASAPAMDAPAVGSPAPTDVRPLRGPRPS